MDSKKILLPILYVDDEEDNLTVFNSTFRRDYEVHLASSGEEGIEIMKKHKIHLVITDQRMPGMTGIQFLEKIIPDYPDCIRMILTGFSDIEAIIQAINTGRVYRYITKPWNKQELKINIDKGLETYNLREQNRKLIDDLKEANQTLEQKVTERTNELEKKNLQISEMDQMKTRFFANISHEFRTPLTLILGPLEDMLTSKELTEKNRITMERMHRSASRLLALINQLLDLSKIDSGSMKLELIRSDLYRFLRIIINSFTPLAERKNIKLNFQIPTDEFLTFYDQDKIEKIIYNLLSNAFKFTPEGGTIDGSIKIVQDKHPTVIKIYVKDSGPGIPAEITEKIFDRFYQLEGTVRKDVSGTGIGLSLTKELVQLQHGDIFLSSKPGKGTEFTVTIPIGFEHLQKGEYIITECSDINESFVTIHAVLPSFFPGHEDHLIDVVEVSDKPQLLVVEDSADIRAHIIENLRDRFLLWEAGDGKEGLQKAIEMVPDLIITDLIMPEMDGLEMCEKLKTDQRTSHIPVIMLTAKASAESRIHGFETGADDYITKPFNIQELVVRIKNLIEQRKMLREKFNRDVRLQPKDISVTSFDEKFLNKTMAIIEENINNSDFDVAKLTDKMALSRVQLFRKLKALTDQSPSEFIRTIRLKRAAQLLDKGFGNIAEVTYSVGFNNLSYFAKCFRELFGLSPSDYARRIN
jgi:signal transduction histidine kinase/AraC-like DNA-binding protein